MNKTAMAIVVAGVALAGCTNSSAIRTSQNTAIIKTSAEPMCGSVGAARVAQKQAAIETIKAGYDRYIITGAASDNSVGVTQLPGHYNTYGTANMYGNRGTFSATSVYQPGPTIVTGSYDQSFAIRMFKNGEAGANQAVSARETLGPEWEKIVKDGVRMCT
ncbi:hypothetical protein [Hoeflea sp. AS16]|uniref:hypothetical protein n=1 Tax=Hoeflea sp. AS16 TaxID=3135779 RepID=UPI00316E9931